MIVLLFASFGHAVQPCGTLEALRALDMSKKVEINTEVLRAEKEEREGFATLPNSQSSENFIIKWNGSINQDAIDQLLESFEYSWQVEIDSLGHHAPVGTDNYLFNVYIGDSGGNSPNSNGAAGYFTLDNDWYPMIVVGKGVLENPEYLDITIAHEFYHAIQAYYARFSYSETEPGAWFWESTATWASAQVYPDNLYYSTFLFSYAFHHHLSVDYFNYPDTGQIDEYYQYGSFIFPLDVSQHISPEIIREIWADSSNEPNPLEVMRNKMTGEGFELDDFWMDHSARMLVYDFPYGAVYESSVYDIGLSYPESENVPTAIHSGMGSDGWETVDETLYPRNYGFNSIMLTGPTEAEYTISIDPGNVGSQGSIAFYGGRVIIVENGEYEYLDIDMQTGELELTGINPDMDIYVVVGAWKSRWEAYDAENFSYQYRIIPTDMVGEPASEPSSEPGSDDNYTGGLEPSSEEGKYGCSTQGSDLFSLTIGGLGCFILVIGTRRKYE